MNFQDGNNDIFNRANFEPWIPGDPDNPVEFSEASLASIDIQVLEINEVIGKGNDGFEAILGFFGDRQAGDNVAVGISFSKVGAPTVNTEDIIDDPVTHFLNTGIINVDEIAFKIGGTVNEAADGYVIVENPPGFEVELLDASNIRVFVSEALHPEGEFTIGMSAANIQFPEGVQVAVYDGVGMPELGDDPPALGIAMPKECDLDVELAIQDPQEEYQLNQIITINAVVTNEGVDVDGVVLSAVVESGLFFIAGAEGCEQLALFRSPVVCQIGAMGSGSSVTVPLQYKVKGVFNPFGRDSEFHRNDFSLRGQVSKGVPRFGTGYVLGRYASQATQVTIIDSEVIDQDGMDPYDIFKDGEQVADGVQLNQPVSLGTQTISTTESVFDLVKEDESASFSLNVDWFPDAGLSVASSYTVLRGNETFVLDGTPANPADPDAVNITTFFSGSNEQNLSVNLNPIPGGEDSWEVNDRLLANLAREVRAGDTVINVLDEDNVILQSNAFNTEQGRGGHYHVGIRFIPDKRLAFDVKVFGPDGAPVETTVVTDTEAEDGLPTAYALFDNYPNPFNPSTRIQYALPEPANVTLSVYDVTGRRIRTLAEGLQPAGTHTATWNGADAYGRLAASGVYLYRLEAGDFVETRKMLMVK